MNHAKPSAFLLAQRTLLFELGAPEGLYAMHAGAELLVGKLQLLLKVAQFALQVGVLGL